jgi:dinuclear metal center YbgI/SA1388 family protein
MPTNLAKITEYLDQYLRVGDVADWENALNGLQVENSGQASRVAAAVDACQFTIDRAAELGADLLLVHHGLFWAGLEPIAGRHARRVRALISADLALYSAHLPLDLHPKVGNNAVLAGMLGMTETAPFGELMGQPIGVMGHVDLTVDELANKLAEQLGETPHVIPAGSKEAGVVAVVTGGGGGHVRQSLDAGVGTFVTGEGPHHSHFDAEEWGINLIYAGHYATETVGVKALAAHLERQFELPWQFIDHPTGL